MSRPARPAAPKRFYEAAATEPYEGDYAVTLDGRKARTPRRRVVAGPAPLAEAMAAEWAAQGETLDMRAMPLTALQGRYLDTRDEADRWGETVLRYARTDLLCYRGDDPALARRQAERWEPYLDRLAERIGARLDVTEGIVAVEQPAAALDGIGRLLDAMPPPARYAARVLTEAGGSAVLALDVLAGGDPGDAFEASRLDERFQAERWGTDAEAAAAEAALRADWDAAVRFWRLSTASE